MAANQSNTASRKSALQMIWVKAKDSTYICPASAIQDRKNDDRDSREHIPKNVAKPTLCRENLPPTCQQLIGVFTCLHRPLLLGGDQRFEGSRLDLDGLLGKAVEEFAA